MNHIQVSNLQPSCTPAWLTRALATAKARHWLLDSIYGRDLLKERLRQLAPDFQIAGRGEAYELDPILERLVDDLRVRDWVKPRTLRQRIVYLRAVLRLTLRVRKGQFE